jgi:hypothetical protein
VGLGLITARRLPPANQTAKLKCCVVLVGGGEWHICIDAGRGQRLSALVGTSSDERPARRSPQPQLPSATRCGACSAHPSRKLADRAPSGLRSLVLDASRTLRVTRSGQRSALRSSGRRRRTRTRHAPMGPDSEHLARDGQAAGWQWAD